VWHRAAWSHLSHIRKIPYLLPVAASHNAIVYYGDLIDYIYNMLKLQGSQEISYLLSLPFEVQAMTWAASQLEPVVSSWATNFGAISHLAGFGWHQFSSASSACSFEANTIPSHTLCVEISFFVFLCHSTSMGHIGRDQEGSECGQSQIKMHYNELSEIVIE
jgi:hypothetical protein